MSDCCRARRASMSARSRCMRSSSLAPIVIRRWNFAKRLTPLPPAGSARWTGSNNGRSPRGRAPSKTSMPAAPPPPRSCYDRSLRWQGPTPRHACFWGSSQMLRKFAVAASVGLFLGASASAAIQPYPANFRTDNILTNGVQIYLRVGGDGPAVVLLHGYGETGDLCSPLAIRLVRNHTVIVPDLRGLGLSSRPADGYDKKTQAADVAGVLDALTRSKRSILSLTISATWLAMHLPPNIQAA